MTDKNGKNAIHAEVEVISEGGVQSNIALPNKILPKHLYLIPIASRPFFPGQVQPIVLAGDYWQETIQRIGETEQKMVGLVYTSNIPAQETLPEDFATIGCMGKILKPTCRNPISILFVRDCSVFVLNAGWGKRFRFWLKWNSQRRVNKKFHG